MSVLTLAALAAISFGYQLGDASVVGPVDVLDVKGRQ